MYCDRPDEKRTVGCESSTVLTIRLQCAYDSALKHCCQCELI